VLLRRDLDTASVKEIVREAGMSSRSFYEFFASKDALILELVELGSQLFLARVTALLGTDDPPARVLDQVLDAYIQLLMPVVAMDRTRIGAKAWEQVEALRRRYFARLVDLGMEWVERLHAEGRVPALPPRPGVELVLLGIEGLTIWYGRENRMEALAAARPAVLQTALALLGLGPEAPSIL
jgi:AcrR family transcriptional regulator